MCDVYNIILYDAHVCVCVCVCVLCVLMFYVYVYVYMYVCMYIVLHGQTVYDRYVIPHKQYGQ